MTMFWVAAGLGVMLAVVFLIMPLARRAKSDRSEPERAEFDLTVYKDQLNEIGRDMERGVLSEDQALAARTEIERRMLAAAETPDTGLEKAETSHPKATMALMVAILIVVPMGALGLYMYLGQPTLPDQPLASRDTPEASQDKLDAADRARAQELLVQLEQRLKDNPEDVQGWMVLAQIYESGNRFAKAAEVYEKVASLTERHPQVLSSWAEMLILMDQTSITPQASKLLKEAKHKDPSDPRTYFYLAMEQQQLGNLEGAMDEYVALLKVSPEDAEWVGQVQAQMKGLAAELGIDVPQVTLLPAQAEEVPQGLSQEQVREAQEMSAEDQQAMIQAMVQGLAEKLRDNPDDLAGWQRLAQAYRVLGNQEGLAEAEANIKRLGAQ